MRTVYGKEYELPITYTMYIKERLDSYCQLILIYSLSKENEELIQVQKMETIKVQKMNIHLFNMCIKICTVLKDSPNITEKTSKKINGIVESIEERIKLLNVLKENERDIIADYVHSMELHKFGIEHYKKQYIDTVAVAKAINRATALNHTKERYAKYLNAMNESLKKSNKLLKTTSIEGVDVRQIEVDINVLTKLRDYYL